MPESLAKSPSVQMQQPCSTGPAFILQQMYGAIESLRLEPAYRLAPFTTCHIGATEASPKANLYPARITRKGVGLSHVGPGCRGPTDRTV